MDFKALIEGAKTVGTILAAFIGVYALAFVGGLVIGVLSNTATSGDITVSSAMNTSLTGVETSYIAAQSALFSPLTTIAALVIVVVLVVIFFKKGNGGANLGNIN
jgi:hypothetical protein